MKKQIVIAAVIGLAVGFLIGTQINRYTVVTSGGEAPRSIKVDRLTGQTWRLGAYGWQELQQR